MFWLKPKDNKLEPQMQFVEPQELWYNLFSYFLPFRNNFNFLSKRQNILEKILKEGQIKLIFSLQ